MFPIDFYRTGNIYENSSVSPLMAMKKYRFKTVQFGSLFTIYIRVLYTSFVLGDWHGCALVQHRALEDNICQILYILCPFFFFFFCFWSLFISMCVNVWRKSSFISKLRLTICAFWVFPLCVCLLQHVTTLLFLFPPNPLGTGQALSFFLSIWILNSFLNQCFITIWNII